MQLRLIRHSHFQPAAHTHHMGDRVEKPTVECRPHLALVSRYTGTSPTPVLAPKTD